MSGNENGMMFPEKSELSGDEDNERKRYKRSAG